MRARARDRAAWAHGFGATRAPHALLCACMDLSEARLHRPLPRQNARVVQGRNPCTNHVASERATTWGGKMIQETDRSRRWAGFPLPTAADRHADVEEKE